MNRGDHLVSPRFGYTHHGLYIGNGQVIHYSGFVNEFSSGEISITSLDEFSNGNKISIQEHLLRTYNIEESIERAISRLGEDWYNVLLNNCEHFVTWCIVGFPSSSQVNLAVITIAEGYKFADGLKKVKQGAEIVSVLANTANTTSSLSTAAGILTTSGIISSAGVTTAITTGIVSTAAAPLVATVVAATVAGYAVKKIWGWVFD